MRQRLAEATNNLSQLNADDKKHTSTITTVLGSVKDLKDIPCIY